MSKQELEWLEPKTPNKIVDEVVDKYRIEKFYVLFSGGKDSVCVAHFIATNYPERFAGCVFTNTGMAVPETRKFVISYCKEMGWKLWMTWPEDGERYIDITKKFGFARQGNHRLIMGYLKFHCWHKFMKWRLSLGEIACFISGVRKKESMIRNKFRLYTKKPLDSYGRLKFLKPFLYKNGTQLWQYFNEYLLKKTPVYEWLNKSGECECGSFTEPWELQMLKKYCPFIYDTIKWLEIQIKKIINKLETYLIPKAKKQHKPIRELKLQLYHLKNHSTWGGRGSTTEDISKQSVFEDFKVNEDYCGESCMVNS